MRRALRILALVPFLGLAFAACGYSNEEAQSKCNLERTAKSTCFGDRTYAQCVGCFEECGEDCEVTESCPVQYLCPQ
jgi:hypothetical protein